LGAVNSNELCTLDINVREHMKTLKSLAHSNHTCCIYPDMKAYSLSKFRCLIERELERSKKIWN
jgi:hypothetical protein